MDLALCLNVFGCLACFQGWHRAREERRRNRHGVTYPKVRDTAKIKKIEVTWRAWNAGRNHATHNTFPSNSHLTSTPVLDSDPSD